MNGRTTIAAPLTDQPAADIRLLLLEQKIQVWRNTRYSHQMDYQALQHVGAPPERMRELEKTLGECEKMLDFFARQIAVVRDEMTAIKE